MIEHRGNKTMNGLDGLRAIKEKKQSYSTLNNQFYYKYSSMLKKKIDHFLLAYYKMTVALIPMKS